MSYYSDLGVIETSVNTAVTIKSAPASISPSDVGLNIQTLIRLIQTGDIDKILSLGNIVNDQELIFKNAGGANGIILNPDSVINFDNGTYTASVKGSTIFIADDATSANQVLIGIIGGKPTLLLRDPITGFDALFQANNLNADKLFTTPNRSGTFELAGDGINPTIAINANCGTGATAVFSPSSDDRSGTIALLTGTGTGTGLLLTVTFHQFYATNTRVIIQCKFGTTQIITISCGDEHTNLFTISGTLADSNNYVITYIVQD